MKGDAGGLRVAHVCRQFSKPSETFILQTLRGLAAAGVDNHVYTRRRIGGGQPGFPETTLYPESALEQLRFGLCKTLLRSYRLHFPLQRMLGDLRLHRRTLLHAHFGGTALAMVPLARESGLPLVATFHAFDLYTRIFSAEAYRPLWPVLARAQVISDAGAERLRELGCPPEKIVRIHCGVDLRRFPFREPRTSGTPVKLLGLGRLVEKKGIDVLLRALALLRRDSTLPGLRVTWYGEGPLLGDLLRLRRRFGLEGVLDFAGGVAHAKVPDILAESDLLVLPSRTAGNGDVEGIPITLLEAGAVGCPVVATRNGGLLEGVAPELRRLCVREGDPEALAAGLADRLRKRGEWPDLARLARRHVEENFSQEAESRQLVDLYRQVTA